jgi:hypothetical protein
MWQIYMLYIVINFLVSYRKNELNDQLHEDKLYYITTVQCSLV